MLSLEDINVANIYDFLSFLENNRNNTISTVNLRLAAIHSLFKYIQKHDLEHFHQCASILNISYKKSPSKPMTYLSIDEMQTLLSQPDVNSKKGIRDLSILATLYETGARVQELLDLTPSQIRLDNIASIELHGKGKKTRLVPVGGELISILKKYFNIFKITSDTNFVFVNSQGNKMTREGIQYIINKYCDKIKVIYPTINGKNISNHTFRHSKAMHLLESGVNLIYIRDFLGHSSIKTTEIYARTNPELLRKHIVDNAKLLESVNKYSVEDKNHLKKWLTDFLRT
jgi:site-specific recombinase XerD